MSETRSRRGAAGIAPLLMIVSLLAMVGLLVWLGMTAEGTQPVVIEETDLDVDSIAASSVFVSVEDLGTDPTQYVGQVVRLNEVPVISPVGTEAFFVELGPGGVESKPFLMKMSPDFMAQGGLLPQGEVTTLIGTVYAMSDSIVSDWSASGVISGGDRLTVEFAAHFIQVLTIR